MLVYQSDRFLLAQPFDFLGAHLELADENGDHPSVVLDRRLLGLVMLRVYGPQGSVASGEYLPPAVDLRR
jgi:hypothetical protein